MHVISKKNSDADALSDSPGCLTITVHTVVVLLKGGN